jgi:ABC-2 type transport system ATP-binding protein
MIEAKELTRYYGSLLAVNRASFSIQTGEIVGLLGPNAAGKSTLMKMLTTYLYPTSGTALVGGKDIIQEALEVRRNIGYLPETLPLYPVMEVKEYLTFVGKARGLKGKDLKQRLEWVRERCGLSHVFRQPIGELSKGFRQRTGLAQALIHDPDIVVLDEPTSGLDPHQIIEIRELIEELAEKRTVIISTHILQEMEVLSQRFIILDQGTIVADDSLPGLSDRIMKTRSITFSVKEQKDSVEPVLKGLGGVINVSAVQDNGTAHFEIEYSKGTDLKSELVRVTAEKSWQLSELKENPASLETVFLALTKSEEAIAETEVNTPEKGGA